MKSFLLLQKNKTSVDLLTNRGIITLSSTQTLIITKGHIMAYIMKEGTSKQAWLGSVSLCPRCNGQQPKAGFKVVQGEEVCACCQREVVTVG
jgi:hypothetical protein